MIPMRVSSSFFFLFLDTVMKRVYVDLARDPQASPPREPHLDSPPTLLPPPQKKPRIDFTALLVEVEKIKTRQAVDLHVQKSPAPPPPPRPTIPAHEKRRTPSQHQKLCDTAYLHDVAFASERLWHRVPITKAGMWCRGHSCQYSSSGSIQSLASDAYEVTEDTPPDEFRRAAQFLFLHTLDLEDMRLQLCQYCRVNQPVYSRAFGKVFTKAQYKVDLQYVERRYMSDVRTSGGGRVDPSPMSAPPPRQMTGPSMVQKEVEECASSMDFPPTRAADCILLE